MGPLYDVCVIQGSVQERIENRIGLFTRVYPNTHANRYLVQNGFAWAVRIATVMDKHEWMELLG